MRTNNSTLEPRQKEVLLPSNYYPSANTVIVGRGKFPNAHIGNKRLRVLVSSFLKKYEQGDKYVKTQIVSDIILMIRVACKGGKGAFVRHDRKTGQWYDLDNSIAREKVTYQFRDLLPDQYSSSSKSKIAKRRAQRKRLNEYHPIIILSPPLEEEQEILPMYPTSMDLITTTTENDSFEEIIVAPTTTSASSSDNDNGCTNVDNNDDVHGYAEFLMKLPILQLEESTVFQN